MKLFLLIIFTCCGFFCVNIYGLMPSQKLKFSSVYTNLGSDCEPMQTENSNDNARLCRGTGGYKIRVWTSSVAQMIAAYFSDDSGSINLAVLSLSADTTTSKIEWRMVNGKPFAVILVVDEYGDIDEENPYLGKKIGELVRIQGLRDLNELYFEIPVRRRNARIAARKIADDGFRDRKTKRSSVWHC